jgi:hypothetical protein
MTIPEPGRFGMYFETWRNSTKNSGKIKKPWTMPRKRLPNIADIASMPIIGRGSRMLRVKMMAIRWIGLDCHETRNSGCRDKRSKIGWAIENPKRTNI